MSTLFEKTITVKQENKEYTNDLINCQIICKENTSETVLYPFCLILINDDIIIAKDTQGNVFDAKVSEEIVDLFKDANKTKKKAKKKATKKEAKKED